MPREAIDAMGIGTVLALSGLLGAQATLSPLHTSGLNLVDASGKTVALRGVNLGGWFVEEMWMTPWAERPPVDSHLPPVRDHVSLWNVVEKRLGRAAMTRVRDAWRDNWITDDDFAKIKQAGFNHVRIPFLDSLLAEPDGLARLHKAVDAAGRAGLYVVLDMHGAPGGQSTADHTGEVDRNRLWFDAANIDRMEQLWTQLGKEFGKDPTVAGFDLMNEPMGAPNTVVLNTVYDRVVRAARKFAPDKVLIVEDGYKGFSTTPKPEAVGWTNICYSLHFYMFGAKSGQEHLDDLGKNAPDIAKLQAERQTPLYIGEFNLEPNGGPDVTKAYVKALGDHGWSWATWTWKTDAKGGPMGQWGLYRRPDKPTPIDPYHDSEAEMIAKIKGERTENFQPVPGLLDALRG